MVSLIVPVYNAQKYLDKCINSLLAQTYKDIEIILVDDGSTDDSLKICNKYADLDARVKVFHQENAGVSAARNYGLDNCCGDYVSFVDSDDWVEQAMVEEMLALLASTNADMGIFGYYIVNNGKQITARVAEKNEVIDISENVERIVQLCLSSVINPPHSKIYKQAILEEYQIRFDVDTSLGEDFIFNLEYVSHIESVALGKEKLYYYKSDNNGSLTNQFRKNLLHEELKMYQKFVSVMNEIGGCSEGQIHEYIMLVVRIYLSNYFFCENNVQKRMMAIKNVLGNDMINTNLKKAKPQKEINILVCLLLKLRMKWLLYLLFDLKQRIRCKNRRCNICMKYLL